MSHEDLNSNVKQNSKKSRFTRADKNRRGNQKSEDFKLPPAQKSDPKPFSLRQTIEKFSVNQNNQISKPKVRQSVQVKIGQLK